MLADGAGVLLSGVYFGEVGSGDHFHAHTGDFAELDGGGAVGEKGLLTGGVGVEGVAGFVEEGLEAFMKIKGTRRSSRVDW